MKKLVSIFLLIILILSNVFIIYAVSQTYSNSNTNYYIMDTTDSTTNIVSSNVLFTQDNDYYYFNITQDLKNTKYSTFAVSKGYVYEGGNYIYNNTVAGIALLPVSNMTGLYIYPRSVNTSSGGSETLTIKLGDTEIAYYNASSSSSKVTNRKNYPMFFSTVSSYYNSLVLGSGPDYVSVLNSENTFQKYSVNEWTSKAKIKILKTKIDQYRYFRFFQKLYWQDNSKVDSSYRFEHRSGITNYSLDLKSIANCEHDWTISGIDDNENHRMVCSKCLWDKTEVHNYIYEYDGINNNICSCGRNKYVNVKYIINDDVTKDVINKVESYSLLEPILYSHKKGHEFLYYKKYQLEVENKEDLSEDNTKLKQVFIENVNTIDTNIENNSLIYEAIYRPFVYYIKFNIENSLGLEFDDEYIDTQTMVYGDSDYLFECKLKKEHYNFLGWAVKPNLDEVVFTDMAEIENLSEIDEDIVNLYPVFLPYTYTVYYTYADDEDYKIKKTYTFNVEEDLEEFNYELPENKTFLGWNILNDTLKNATTKHLEQYIDKDNQVLMLVANIYEEVEKETEKETDSDINNQDNSDDSDDKNEDNNSNNNSSNSSKNGESSKKNSDRDSDSDSSYESKNNNNNNNKSNSNSNNYVVGTDDGTPPYYNKDNINSNSTKSNEKTNYKNLKDTQNKTNDKITETLIDETNKFQKVTASMNNLLNIKSFIYDYESNQNEITAFNFTLATKSDVKFDDKSDDKIIKKTSGFIDIVQFKNLFLVGILVVFSAIFLVFTKLTYKKFKKLEKYYENI